MKTNQYSKIRIFRLQELDQVEIGPRKIGNTGSTSYQI